MNTDQRQLIQCLGCGSARMVTGLEPLEPTGQRAPGPEHKALALVILLHKDTHGLAQLI